MYAVHSSNPVSLRRCKLSQLRNWNHFNRTHTPGAHLVPNQWRLRLDCNVHGSPLCLIATAASYGGSAPPTKLRSPSGLLKWKVVDQKQQLLGFVQEVIQPQEALGGTCPVLRIQLQQADPASQTSEQHLIPWVPAIVKDILSQSHTIVISPPSGLLELGRQQVLLHQLEPELKSYGKAAPDSMAARLGQCYMPTKQQLIHHGREDLVKQVVSAGGFIHVAHLLGLRAKRKPEGFWDEPENLDRELSLFVAGMWTCLKDSSADESYYYNQVTGRSQWELPQSPQSIPLDDAGTFIFAEDDADRVMPSRSAVLSAGRFDLHHGIMYNGGYRAAAAALERPHTWPRHKRFSSPSALARELHAFNREHGLPANLIPPAGTLRIADRLDLLSAILHFGGSRSLAPQVGMSTQRGSGFPDSASAVKQLLIFVEQLHISSACSRSTWHMPTQQQLRQAGRLDLHAAIVKFGARELAQAADLKINRRGRPRAA